MSEVRFVIPENLDLEKLERDHKEEFKTNGFRKGPMLFILDALQKSRALKHKETDEKKRKYFPLSANSLQSVVRKYNKYIGFLISANVIKGDGQFMLGKKCFGYTYCDEYNGQPLREVVVTDYKLAKSIRIRNENNFKKRKRELKELHHVTQWLDTGKLQIDIGGCYKWLSHYAEQRIENINPLLSEQKRQEEFDRIINRREDLLKHLVGINAKTLSYNQSKNGKRLFTPLTNLKRELRNFLTYEGQELVELDIKSSQPYISTVLFDKDVWRDSSVVMKDKLCLQEILPENIYKGVKEYSKYINYITTVVSSESQYRQGFEKYKNLIKSGNFYEYIKEKLEKDYPKRFSNRDKTKKEFLLMIFSQPHERFTDFYKPCYIFQKHFPDVYNLYTEIQSAGINFLPIILQRIESFVVLNKICKKISDLQPHIPLFTVHDSIITTKGNEALVKQIMTSELEKWICLEPKVEVKHLTPKNLEVAPVYEMKTPRRIIDECTMELFLSVEDLASHLKITADEVKWMLSSDERNICYRYAA